jgi:hypothetical protein
MTEDREQPDPIEALLDLLVYAPLGLVTQLEELLPGLIERGRSQAVMARTIGEFAVRSGSQKVQERAGEAPKQLEHLLRSALEVVMSRLDESRASTAADTGAEAPSSSAPISEVLPIEGYDDLRAAEIVPMLATLSKSELGVVFAYESANRQRRTILNRIRQLGVDVA